MPADRCRRPAHGEQGQALLLLVAALLVVVVGAIVAGAIANGLGARADRQRTADIAALAGARAMRSAYPRLFEPPLIDGEPNPSHLERGGYLSLGGAAARSAAARNGAKAVAVSFPGADAIAPMRIRVAIGDGISVEGAKDVEPRVFAEAELAPPATAPALGAPGQGEYRGPFAYRQGKPMRPDTAQAFDRLAAAARADGVSLMVASAFRSNAEQAILWARNPDPKWVAPPGTSLHRLGTEIDFGPSSAYGWLLARATKMGWVRRYPWEPWHFGWAANAGTASVGYGAGARPEPRSGRVPDFVPAQFAPAFAAAAQRWNVSAALLAAQAYRESNFNPMARSPAGAQGIAQFMPGTAAAYGLKNPFDPAAAIDAQARMMRDLLRRFASVPLALAAYNAGSGRVARCMCIPPIPETQAYVAGILGMLNGVGDSAGLLSAGLEIRLVR